MPPAARRIAAIVGADAAAAQMLLAAAVAGWRAAGTRVVGVLAEAHGLPDRICAAGILRDIVSGTPYPIYLETALYLETAPPHTSCHLDAAGVEAACAAICARVQASDLVVLSKFGKLEAAGAGLAGAFAAAIAAGRPVLTTVSARQRDAWQAFAPDGTALAAEAAALQAWWRGLGTG